MSALVIVISHTVGSSATAAGMYRAGAGIVMAMAYRIAMIVTRIIRIGRRARIYIGNKQVQVGQG